MDDVKKIVIISEGTGETAHRLLHAILAQYPESQVNYTIENIYRMVRSTQCLDTIFDKITDDYLVIFSLITQDLRDYSKKLLKNRGIIHVNILEPMRVALEKFFPENPDYKPGLLQTRYNKFYKKMDAIGYTVRHDDGLGHQIEETELLLLGPSRSCKTPISMYITSNYGLKVANIPIVPDEIMTQHLLKRIEPVDSRLIFGLVMSPDVLALVRGRRAELLSGKNGRTDELNGYQDIEEIKRELVFCRRLYAQQKWSVVDVTERAIEEISTEIISALIAKMEAGIL